LPFERRLVELEVEVAREENESDRSELEAAIEHEYERVFANLTAWQRVQLARHPQRPRMLDYLSRILDDFIEFHGDRVVGDDQAVIAGIGRFRGTTVAVVGQQKGVTTDEKVQRNFGMAHPEGYRKALRVFHMAERLHLPILSFVDTPAAHPGIEAEQRGQGSVIARNILESLSIDAPMFAVVLGEGGSGGALGIAVADWIAMFEYAIYMICPPERCAEILWRDVGKKKLAAESLKLTSTDLMDLGVIDSVLSEPRGGAHRDHDKAAQVLAEEIERFIQWCQDGRWSLDKRRDKFRNMGVWLETGADGGG